MMMGREKQSDIVRELSIPQNLLGTEKIMRSILLGFSDTYVYILYKTIRGFIFHIALYWLMTIIDCPTDTIVGGFVWENNTHKIRSRRAPTTVVRMKFSI